MFSRRDQPRIAAPDRPRQFFLGIDQLRRIQGVQRLPFFYRIAGGLDVQLFYPALDPGMHMNQSLLVIPHVTHRGDLRMHDAAFGQRRAHAQAVAHLGRDGDGARAVRVAGALVRIDRHQVHAHR